MNDAIEAVNIEVELLSPKMGDYLVFYVDTGKMRATMASEHVMRVARQFNVNLVPNDGINRIFLSKSETRGSRIELITPNINLCEKGENNGNDQNIPMRTL
jgi:hypothetical protein